jgi:hypothetical protein
LIFLFVGYLFGWFVSFVFAWLGNIKSKRNMAIAHGYAILLLLLFSNLVPIEDISFLMLFLCFFNAVALIFFLYQYQALYLKEQANNSKIKESIKDILPNV